MVPLVLVSVPDRERLGNQLKLDVVEAAPACSLIIWQLKRLRYLGWSRKNGHGPSVMPGPAVPDTPLWRSPRLARPHA